MVEVKGNIDNLQSSIDFYLNITSKDGVEDSRFMRDRFFEIFKREDSYRKENFLEYQDVISDNYEIDLNAEPELFGEEEVYDFDTSYFAKKVEEVEVKTEIESVVVEEEVPYIEREEEYLEDEVGYPDEEDYFSSWGNNDDEEDEVGWSADEEEEDEFLDNWSTNEEQSDEVGFDEEDNFSNWGTQEPEEESGFDDRGVQNTKSESNEVDDLGFFDGCFEDDIVEEVVEVKNVVVEKPKTPIETVDVDTVPKDLRDFVKMHPNCELTLVYKYFTKKEVEKQLRLGRVFKRKNKLMI